MSTEMIKIQQHFEWYFDKGYLTQRDGNACIRTSDGFLVTASGVRKDAIALDDYVIVDENMKILQAPYGNKPSIETQAHIDILTLSNRTVSVHVHSPNAVALAAVMSAHRQELKQSFNKEWPELFRYTHVGDIVRFLTPGSEDLHLAIKNAILMETQWGKTPDILILENHGVIASGNSLDDCKEHIMRLEHISMILLKILSANNSEENIRRIL